MVAEAHNRHSSGAGRLRGFAASGHLVKAEVATSPAAADTNQEQSGSRQSRLSLSLYPSLSMYDSFWCLIPCFVCLGQSRGVKEQLAHKTQASQHS